MIVAASLLMRVNEYSVGKPLKSISGDRDRGYVHGPVFGLYLDDCILNTPLILWTYSH